jgi:acylphosphatase
VNYSGRVQGVGFRYTTRSIASRFDLVGYVRNLSDGRVELVAEGEAAELHAFLEAVKETLGHYIREAAVNRSAPTGEFDSFEIRF